MYIKHKYLIYYIKHVADKNINEIREKERERERKEREKTITKLIITTTTTKQTTKHVQCIKNNKKKRQKNVIDHFPLFFRFEHCAKTTEICYNLIAS